MFCNYNRLRTHSSLVEFKESNESISGIVVRVNRIISRKVVVVSSSYTLLGKDHFPSGQGRDRIVSSSLVKEIIVVLSLGISYRGKLGSYCHINRNQGKVVILSLLGSSP